MSDISGPWLSVRAAATYLGLPSEKALREMARRGTVRGYHLGRLLRFSQPELDALLSGSPTCAMSTATK
jgi:excisionase family DNA binding protein